NPIHMFSADLERYRPYRCFLRSYRYGESGVRDISVPLEGYGCVHTPKDDHVSYFVKGYFFGKLTRLLLTSTIKMVPEIRTDYSAIRSIYPRSKMWPVWCSHAYPSTAQKLYQDAFAGPDVVPFSSTPAALEMLFVSISQA